MVQPPSLAVVIEREEDGRRVPAVSGALAYGSTPEEAAARTKALALRALAERLEHGEPD